MTRSSLLAAFLLVACGVDVARHNAESAEKVRGRAAFEMHCDGPGIKLTPLEYGDGVSFAKGAVRQFGVDGCGQRGVYVWTSGTWVLNSAAERPRS